jgi:hypothetical protein
MAGLVIGQNVINGAVSYEIGGASNKYTVPEFLIPYGGGKIGVYNVSEPELLGRRQGALGAGYAVGCRHCES